MKRLLLMSAMGFIMAALVADQAFSADSPDGGRRSMGNLRDGGRRSMGNLRDSDRPEPNSGGTNLHRPWSYGNPPYYRRPPTTPYYVVPQPVYPPPYYGYPPYPYPAYRYRSYRMTPHPWGPTLHYPVPYWAY